MWEKTFDAENIESQTDDILDLLFFTEKKDYILIFLIVLSSAGILIFSIKFRVFHLWVEFLRSNLFLKIASYPLLISGIIIIGGIIFRTILWFKYKPMTIKEGEKIEWPFISVIMPALNEEELIEKAIDSIFSSLYPQDKLEVICINDGSTDLTLFKMMRAKKKYGDKLKIISFRENLGKRRALYAGLKKSRGEIIVTVDTDSKIGRNALKNIVIPLIKEKNTGAVAGRVSVLNEKENFLTKMLSIRYSISFNFGRAYQSVYGSVFCCPGALTAYRKSVLVKFIHQWVHQTFWNVPCTYGEDRALTTQILKAGYMTRFQSNAIVYTKVPTNFSEMSKMYLRWTRSYIRESIIFAAFMFTKYRKKNRLLPIADFFFLNFLHPFHIFAFGIMIYSFFVDPLLIIRHLALIVVVSFFLSLYYLRTNKSLNFIYGIPYAIITAFFLWWLVPYAALTLKNQSWLTR